MKPEKLKDLYDIFKLLHQTENDIGNFYRKCADKFPGEHDFWLHLAGDEDRHKNYLIEIAGEISDNPEKFKMGLALRKDALEGFAMIAQRNGRLLDQGLIKRPQAFVVAMDFENSLIEMAYPKLVTTEDPGINQMLRELDEESVMHREQVQKKVLEINSREDDENVYWEEEDTTYTPKHFHSV